MSRVPKLLVGTMLASCLMGTAGTAAAAADTVSAADAAALMQQVAPEVEAPVAPSHGVGAAPETTTASGSGVTVQLPETADSPIVASNGSTSVELTPLRVTDSASDAHATGDATVFANTARSADTAVKASAMGFETFTQIRDALAGERYSWRVTLTAGQRLQKLSDGSVVVTEASRQLAERVIDPTTSPEDRAGAISDAEQFVTGDIDGTPDTSINDVPEPGSSEAVETGELVATDAAAQADIAEAAAKETRDEVPDGQAVVATIGTPWAKDANGDPVASHYDIDGDVVTLVVDHQDKPVAYPVVADPWVWLDWGLFSWDDAGTTAVMWSAETGWVSIGLAEIGITGLDNSGSSSWVTAGYPGSSGSTGSEKSYCLLRPWNALKCKTAKSLATTALASAQYHFQGSPWSLEDGTGDAYRHCYWSGLMTLEWNRSDAKGFGDRHEDHGRRNGESQKHFEYARDMDQHNNFEGRDRAGEVSSRGPLITKCLNMTRRTIYTSGSNILWYFKSGPNTTLAR